MVAVARLRKRLDGPVVLAGEAHPLAFDHRQDDLQCLIEFGESFGERAELEAELIVLEFEPAGTDAQHGPPLTDHIQGGDDFRQQRRIAIGVAGDQGAEQYVLSRRRQRAECGIGLQHRLIGGAEHGQLVEVIHHEDRIESRGLRLPGLCDDGWEQLRDRGAVGEVGDLETEANRHWPTITAGMT